MGRGANQQSSAAISVATRADAALDPSERRQLHARKRIDAYYLRSTRVRSHPTMTLAEYEIERETAIGVLPHEVQAQIVADIRTLLESDDPTDARRVRHGLEILILTNSGLRKQVTRSWNTADLSDEDKQRITQAVVMTAVRGFDQDRGAVFASYFKQLMIYALKDAEPDGGHFRINPLNRRRMRDVRYAITRLEARGGRRPSLDAIAEESGQPHEFVVDAIPHFKPHIALNDLVDADNQTYPHSREAILAESTSSRRLSRGRQLLVGDIIGKQEMDYLRGVDAAEVIAAISKIDSPVQRYILTHTLREQKADDPEKDPLTRDGQQNFYDGYYQDQNGIRYSSDRSFIRAWAERAENVLYRDEATMRRAFERGQLRWLPAGEHAAAVFEITGTPPSMGSVQFHLEAGIEKVRTKLQDRGIAEDYVYRGRNQIKHSATAQDQLRRRIAELTNVSPTQLRSMRRLLEVGRALCLVDEDGRLVADTE
jgi:hypothetical protein